MSRKLDKRFGRKKKPKEETYMKMLQTGLIDLLPSSLAVIKQQLNDPNHPLDKRSTAAKYILDCLLSINIFERSLKKDAEKNGDEEMQHNLMKALEEECKIIDTVKKSGFDKLPEGKPEEEA